MRVGVDEFAHKAGLVESARVASVRTVKTYSGAIAVQIVHSSRRGARKIEHLGSAHTPEDVEAFKAVARQRIEVGQAQLDLRLEFAAASAGPLEIVGSRMGASVGRFVAGLRRARVR